MGNKAVAFLTATAVAVAGFVVVAWMARIRVAEWGGSSPQLAIDAVCIQRVRGISYRTSFPVTEFEKTTKVEYSKANAELTFKNGNLVVKRVSECSGLELHYSSVDLATQSESYQSNSGMVKVKTSRNYGHVVGYEVTPTVGTPLSFRPYGRSDAFSTIVLLEQSGAVLVDGSNGNRHRWLVYHAQSGNWNEFVLDYGLIFRLDDGESIRVPPSKVSS